VTGSPAAAVRLQHVWFAQNLGAQHYDEFAALADCRPRDWHLIEALPRTSVGKVRRFKL
jgi:acyl-coenzyme A synthetase/AMP-(fatty) acid ligase